MSWAEDNMIDLDPEDLGLLDTEPVWQCKDGTLIPISEMAETHINNCIAMIKRSIRNNEPWRVSYLNILKNELYNRKTKSLCKKIIYISVKVD